MKAFKLIAFSICAIGIAGCQTTMDRGFSLMTPEQEISIDQQICAELDRQAPFLKDEQVVSYVNEVGQKVANVSARKDVPYKFKVIDQPAVNAFTSPHGSIYVYRGLLQLMDSEAELAALLGHEIGHVAAYHAGKRYTRELGIGLVVGAVTQNTQPKSVQQIAASLLGQGVMGRYSQEEELQADRLGAEYAFNAGYNPDGAVRLMELLKQQEDKTASKGDSLLLPFFGTHPPATQRIENLKLFVSQYSPAARQWNRLNADTYRQKILTRIKTP